MNTLVCKRAPVLSKEFLDIKSTTECGFTLKHIHDMIVTYRQTHHTDKYSQHSSIIWPVWLNHWVFVYELSAYGFESGCSHLNLIYYTCFELGVLRHLGNCIDIQATVVWIHSEMSAFFLLAKRSRILNFMFTIIHNSSKNFLKHKFNPFMAQCLFLCPLEMSEN